MDCTDCRYCSYVICDRGVVLAEGKTKPYTKWEVAMVQMGIKVEEAK